MSWTQKYLGIALIIISCLLPIGIWATLSPFKEKFGNIFLTWTSIGQLLGLVGFTLFSISLLLSSRLKILEKFFQGINHVYIIHHIVGSLSLVALLLHVLSLLASRLVVSPKYAASLLWPWTDLNINFGIFALLLLISLLVITLYAKLPYHIWLLTHKFLGVSYMFGSLHSFLIPSNISTTFILKCYYGALVVICLFLYSFRTILGRFLVPRLRFTIDSVIPMANKCVELRLNPTTQNLMFKPGQFIFISILDKKIGTETHPFSISSSPNQQLTLTIKSLGDWTKKLEAVAPGTPVKIEGPFGAFTALDLANKNQVWIGGGIGITPFISLARSLNQSQNKIELYYAVKDESEALYLTELLEIAKANPNFTVTPFYSATMGRLSADKISSKLPDFISREYFICGPPPMMHSLKQQLKGLKIPSKQIHSEEFSMD